MSRRKQAIVIETYSIHGTRLRVEADSIGLANTVRSAFGPFARAELAGNAFILRLQYGQPVLSGESWRVFHEGDLPGGMFCRSLVQPHRWAIELPGRAILKMHTADGRADVTVLAGCEWAAQYACVIPAVCGFLAAGGQHVLHAACLRVNQSDYSPAVLIAGHSGMGKSTTALAMSRQGFGLLSDDTCFLLGKTEGGLGIWGLPRACKVHSHTIALLPWLKACPSRPAAESDECFIDFDQLAASDAHHIHEPAAVMLLEPRNAQEHRSWPADPIAALVRLTRENVRAVDSLANGVAGNAFRLLGRLLTDCPAYHLSVGPDLSTVGAHIAQQLRTVRLK